VFQKYVHKSDANNAPRHLDSTPLFCLMYESDAGCQMSVALSAETLR
jgi:hypothetical protein